MSDDLPAFDEVHVVSDLHMGGRGSAQVFRDTGRLANFILRLGGQRPDGTLALVLNGDVFDTLAEDVVGYIAVDDAAATLARIIGDPSFAPVWQALAGFVRRDGRALVFVIGNHDLEIALPTVQRLLLKTVAGDDPVARARVRFSAFGAGFACSVGGARVFCTHGNEVDAWNFNRYEDLARLARRTNAGHRMDPGDWRPSAGTKLVKDVVNGVKRRFAWIDLLKPETSAALGALLVLDPSQATQLGTICGLLGNRQRGVAQARARLSDDGSSSPGAGRTRPATFPEMLGSRLRAAVGEARDDDMLRTAERHLRQAPTPAADPDQRLGVPQFALDRLRGIGQAEALRHALLDWLAGDKSFDASERDDTFDQVTASVGDAVDFLVTGHTHLERAIDRGHGRFYFNAGTWIRLLRLTPSVLADGASFAPAWHVLHDGRMSAIDEAVFGGAPFVLNRSSAVAIRVEGDRVVGELRHVDGDGRGEPQVVTRFERRRQP